MSESAWLSATASEIKQSVLSHCCGNCHARSDTANCAYLGPGPLSQHTANYFSGYKISQFQLNVTGHQILPFLCTDRARMRTYDDPGGKDVASRGSKGYGPPPALNFSIAF
ncbi:hypothetical protein J6590_023833 [Homalodisca vitripennis]|nr:hypothetical protein J6590_023833 [Homalodisca vitripennis]